MKGLRETMARAIEDHCGPGIITDQEQDALMRGALLLQQQGENDRANALRAMAFELHQPAKYLINGTRDRVAQYYYGCADVVISTYDKWIESAHANRPPNPSDQRAAVKETT